MGQSPTWSADKCTDALSSRWLPLILLHGAPPPHPGLAEHVEDLHVFGSYIHSLALWTDACRQTYMEWENITENEWGEDYNRCKRLPFEREFINWSYTLKRQDYE